MFPGPRTLLVFLLFLATMRAFAAPPPDPAELEFRQHPGQAIPLVRGLHDQDGHEAGLQEYLGKRPVVFVLGYYHCPMLCSTLMDAVLQRLHGLGVPYEVVSVSIDPTETPGDAARKYGYYSGLMSLGPVKPTSTESAEAAETSNSPRHLHLLTATPSAIAALTKAVGFPYRRDPDTGQFYHPAGFVVLTPEGRISRYFLGVGFEPRDLRLALVEASHGKVGGLADRLVLLCSHYDPSTGRYNVAAMAMARAAGLGTLMALLSEAVRSAPQKPPGGPRMSSMPSVIPPAASSIAGRTDALFYSLLGVSAAMALLLTILAVAFCIRYRKGSKADRRDPPDHANGLEWTWTIAPLLAFLGLFLWGAYDYSALTRPPDDAMPVYVVAKQWVWTLQHANGKREIDELHVPVGTPVRLLMSSQDVIHSFYVPEFRIKQDVVPGRYTSLWFTATRAGTYHLLCAEFCGTDHASMGGGIVAMPPEQFSRWLAQDQDGPDVIQRGYQLFREHGCAGCHDARSTVHAPDLDHLFGRRIFLQDGRVVIADEAYIHDSIVEPGKDVVAGYAPIMPSFAGQFSESDLMALVAYLRSDHPKEAAAK